MWARSVRSGIETREQVSKKQLLKFEAVRSVGNPLRASAAGKQPQRKLAGVDLGMICFKVTN